LGIEKKLVKIIQNNICGLIPCAGKGSRSGLDYPKTLYVIDRKPILNHITDLLLNFTNNLSIIINPTQKKIFDKNIKKLKKNINVLFQKKPLGMGNAIISSEKYIIQFDHVLLIWGDVPFIKYKTVKKLIKTHLENKNDFTFVTTFTKNPYTYIKRDSNNNLLSVVETRETNFKLDYAERDIGLFLFKPEIILKYLKMNLKNKMGRKTKEHGFLYIIEHLIKKNHKIEALNIANESETRTLNKISDLKL